MKLHTVTKRLHSLLKAVLESELEELVENLNDDNTYNALIGINTLIAYLEGLPEEGTNRELISKDLENLRQKKAQLWGPKSGKYNDRVINYVSR